MRARTQSFFSPLRVSGGVSLSAFGSWCQLFFGGLPVSATTRHRPEQNKLRTTELPGQSHIRRGLRNHATQRKDMCKTVFAISPFATHNLSQAFSCLNKARSRKRERSLLLYELLVKRGRREHALNLSFSPYPSVWQLASVVLQLLRGHARCLRQVSCLTDASRRRRITPKTSLVRRDPAPNLSRRSPYNWAHRMRDSRCP